MNIFKYIINVFTNDKLEKKLIIKLKEKNLDEHTINIILFYTKKSNEYKNLLNYLSNPTVTYNNLLDNSNLIELFKPINLSENLKLKLINLTGLIDNVSFGKGEISLMLFIKDTIKYGKKGDIKLHDNILEVKRGKCQVAASKHTKRLSKHDIFHGIKSKEFIKKYKINLSPGKTWVEAIQKSNPDIEELREVLKEIYPNLEIDINLSSPTSLNDSIGLALAKDYLVGRNLLFINDKNNNYMYIEGYNEFKYTINHKVTKFNLASDTIPRCYLNI
jgi:hypothetical protein